MERLTKRLPGGLVAPLACIGDKDYDITYVIQTLAERLADYEDTGLTPEQVAGLINTKQSGGNTMATLTKRVQTDIGWGTITTEAKNGRLTQFLQERDEITFICKDGAARTAVAAKVTDTGVLFAMKEITADRPMYNRFPGKLLSWAESDERQVMNTKDLTMLPDDLVAEITPRRIVQLIGGEEVVTEDKLWAFSATELFGRGGRRTESDGPGEEQLPIFKTEADRVKNYNGETWWYNTRSPLASSTTLFCAVYHGGNAYSSGAALAHGVAFGFMIGNAI